MAPLPPEVLNGSDNSDLNTSAPRRLEIGKGRRGTPLKLEPIKRRTHEKEHEYTEYLEIASKTDGTKEHVNQIQLAVPVRRGRGMGRFSKEEKLIEGGEDGRAARGSNRAWRLGENRLVEEKAKAKGHDQHSDGEKKIDESSESLLGYGDCTSDREERSSMEMYHSPEVDISSSGEIKIEGRHLSTEEEEESAREDDEEDGVGEDDKEDEELIEMKEELEQLLRGYLEKKRVQLCEWYQHMDCLDSDSLECSATSSAKKNNHENDRSYHLLVASLWELLGDGDGGLDNFQTQEGRNESRGTFPVVCRSTQNAAQKLLPIGSKISLKGLRNQDNEEEEEDIDGDEDDFLEDPAGEVDELYQIRRGTMGKIIDW